jgi:triacylglycerol lipase
VSISPAIAAAFAKAAYGIRLQSDVTKAIRGTLPALADMVDLTTGTPISGSSGVALRQTSGFAMVLPGKGAWQGQYFVLVRGTVTGPDWLTDFHASVEPGPGGLLVHSGFNRVCKSILPDILGSLRNKNPTRIHCVGHSLGGAVAALVAADLDAHVGGTSLYTFGSPRPGVRAFSEGLTWSLGDTSINRGFNISDVVPMVPIYPFLHVPTLSEGALIGESHGLISISAHFMDNYAPAVENSSWEGLRLRAKTMPLTIEDLLEQASESVRIPGTGMALHILGRVLGALITQMQIAIGGTITARLTLLDRMAWMLATGAQVSVDLAEKVGRFIQYVFRFLGRVADKGAKLTAEFVGYVLNLLISRLVGIARASLMNPNG